jgi:peptidyl-prolyl cis-trans isomerase SurA
MQGVAKYKRNEVPAGSIYTFAAQKLSNRSFADFVSGRSAKNSDTTSLLFINEMIKLKSTEDILEYENSVLENKYPEFRYLMNEFHDGMLLFEISNRNVWKRVSTDSLGLQKFYENNKNNWLSKKSIDGEIYTLKDPQGGKLLQTALKKYSGRGDMDDRLNKKFNKNDSLLTIKHGIWFKGDDTEIDKTEWTEGLHTITDDRFPSVLYIKKVYEPAPLKLKDIQGDVMTEYQTYLEKEWIGQLNKKYSVKVDSQVLEEVKKNIKQ